MKIYYLFFLLVVYGCQYTKATEKESKIVNNTISKIVDLKEQVKDLKNELKDVKKELNNINSDTSQKFKLFPISDN